MAEPAAPAAPPAEESAGTPAELHATANQACKYLQQLATGLAQAGASEPTVDAVKQMYDVCHQIVEALGKGQEQTGDEEPPAEEAPPAEEETPPQNYDEAAAQTHQMMQESAAKQQ